MKNNAILGQVRPVPRQCAEGSVHVKAEVGVFLPAEQRFVGSELKALTSFDRLRVSGTGEFSASETALNLLTTSGTTKENAISMSRLLLRLVTAHLLRSI